MSLSSKITDDEMRYFQFKARQLYLLRKEDHEWNEFCKKNTCTCCTCQTSSVLEVKEVGVQSFPKRILPTSARSTDAISHSKNKDLPQTLNEIKTKLEKIDLTLSEMKVPANEMKEVTKPKEIFDKQLNTLTFPMESDMAESVKSVVNERRMQLIQDSLKMSLQRLHSAAAKITRPNSNVKIKKKSSGYFIPRELERQRAAARQAYLASLNKIAVEPKILPHSSREKTGAKKESLKPKTMKTSAKPNLRKFNKSNNQKEESTLVGSSNSAETKDENIETAIDAIMEDVLGETVLAINKIKQTKNEKSSSFIQNTQHVAKNSSLRNLPVNVDSKEADTAMAEQFQNKLVKIKQHLQRVKKGAEPSKQETVEIKKISEPAKNTTESEQLIFSNTSSSIQSKSVHKIKGKPILRELIFDPLKSKQISKCRKDYWSYLDRISRTKKGNFDPWALSNLVSESLLDDCIQEIAEELQDVPASLIADLYDQEFLQSI